MKKKSQIKMTETIGILVIFFVLIVFGLIFYSNYQKSALLKQRNLLLERDAVALSLKISYLPELSCESKEKIGACIDLYKLNALKTLSQNEPFYSTLFGASDIYVSDLINNKTYSIYNSSLENFTKRTRIRTPLLLRNTTVLSGDLTKTEDYFGVLYVDSYR